MSKFDALRVCFYAAVTDDDLFDLVEFYKQDIDILRKLGHKVTTARRPTEAWGSFDLYWVWWQTSGIPALVAATLRQRPSVLLTALSDRDPTESGMKAKGIAAHTAAAISLRLADLTLATCEDTRRGLLTGASGPVLTAPLGVDTNVYCPAGPRDDALVVTISHLTRDNVARKRVIDVVRIAAMLPDLRFLIVGRELDGAMRVRKEISRCAVEDRVELLGEVSPATKRELLSRATLYLQPTRYEAFGMAIAEAMASGAPAISNAVGNVPDLIGDTGPIAPAEASVDELAELVRTLAADSEREARGRAARRRIERLYSIERRLSLVDDVLTRTLQRVPVCLAAAERRATRRQS